MMTKDADGQRTRAKQSVTSMLLVVTVTCMLTHVADSLTPPPVTTTPSPPPETTTTPPSTTIAPAAMEVTCPTSSLWEIAPNTTLHVTDCDVVVLQITIFPVPVADEMAAAWTWYGLNVSNTRFTDSVTVALGNDTVPTPPQNVRMELHNVSVDISRPANVRAFAVKIHGNTSVARNVTLLAIGGRFRVTSTSGGNAMLLSIYSLLGSSSTCVDCNIQAIHVAELTAVSMVNGNIVPSPSSIAAVLSIVAQNDTILTCVRCTLTAQGPGPPPLMLATNLSAQGGVGSYVLSVVVDSSGSCYGKDVVLLAMDVASMTATSAFSNAAILSFVARDGKNASFRCAGRCEAQAIRCSDILSSVTLDGGRWSTVLSAVSGDGGAFCEFATLLLHASWISSSISAMVTGPGGSYAGMLSMITGSDGSQLNCLDNCSLSAKNFARAVPLQASSAGTISCTLSVYVGRDPSFAMMRGVSLQVDNVSVVQAVAAVSSAFTLSIVRSFQSDSSSSTSSSSAAPNVSGVDSLTCDACFVSATNVMRVASQTRLSQVLFGEVFALSIGMSGIRSAMTNVTIMAENVTDMLAAAGGNWAVLMSIAQLPLTQATCDHVTVIARNVGTMQAQSTSSASSLMLSMVTAAISASLSTLLFMAENVSSMAASSLLRRSAVLSLWKMSTLTSDTTCDHCRFVARSVSTITCSSSGSRSTILSLAMFQNSRGTFTDCDFRAEGVDAIFAATSSDLALVLSVFAEPNTMFFGTNVSFVAVNVTTALMASVGVGDMAAVLSMLQNNSSETTTSSGNGTLQCVKCSMMARSAALVSAVVAQGSVATILSVCIRVVSNSTVVVGALTVEFTDLVMQADDVDSLVASAVGSTASEVAMVLSMATTIDSVFGSAEWMNGAGAPVDVSCHGCRFTASRGQSVTITAQSIAAFLSVAVAPGTTAQLLNVTFMAVSFFYGLTSPSTEISVQVHLGSWSLIASLASIGGGITCNGCDLSLLGIHSSVVRCDAARGAFAVVLGLVTWGSFSLLAQFTDVSMTAADIPSRINISSSSQASLLSVVVSGAPVTISNGSAVVRDVDSIVVRGRIFSTVLSFLVIRTTIPSNASWMRFLAERVGTVNVTAVSRALVLSVVSFTSSLSCSQCSATAVDTAVVRAVSESDTAAVGSLVLRFSGSRMFSIADWVSSLTRVGQVYASSTTSTAVLSFLSPTEATPDGFIGCSGCQWSAVNVSQIWSAIAEAPGTDQQGAALVLSMSGSISIAQGISLMSQSLDEMIVVGVQNATAAALSVMLANNNNNTDNGNKGGATLVCTDVEVILSNASSLMITSASGSAALLALVVTLGDVQVNGYSMVSDRVVEVNVSSISGSALVGSVVLPAQSSAYFADITVRLFDTSLAMLAPSERAVFLSVLGGWIACNNCSFTFARERDNTSNIPFITVRGLLVIMAGIQTEGVLAMPTSPSVASWAMPMLRVAWALMGVTMHVVASNSSCLGCIAAASVSPDNAVANVSHQWRHVVADLLGAAVVNVLQISVPSLFIHYHVADGAALVVSMCHVQLNASATSSASLSSSFVAVGSAAGGVTLSLLSLSDVSVWLFGNGPCIALRPSSTAVVVMQRLMLSGCDFGWRNRTTENNFTSATDRAVVHRVSLNRVLLGRGMLAYFLPGLNPFLRYSVAFPIGECAGALLGPSLTQSASPSRSHSFTKSASPFASLSTTQSASLTETTPSASSTQETSGSPDTRSSSVTSSSSESLKSCDFSSCALGLLDNASSSTCASSSCLLIASPSSGIAASTFRVWLASAGSNSSSAIKLSLHCNDEPRMGVLGAQLTLDSSSSAVVHFTVSSTRVMLNSETEVTLQASSLSEMAVLSAWVQSRGALFWFSSRRVELTLHVVCSSTPYDMFDIDVSSTNGTLISLGIRVTPETLPTASAVTTILTTSQWTGSFGGVTASSTAARIVAWRRLMFCTSDSSGPSSGGVFKVTVGGNDALGFSRGAVVGNVALVGGVLVVSLAFGMMWSLCRGDTGRLALRNGALGMRLPSSLVGFWTMAAPTSLEGALYLLLWSSRGDSGSRGGDAVLYVVGFLQIVVGLLGAAILLILGGGYVERVLFRVTLQPRSSSAGGVNPALLHRRRSQPGGDGLRALRMTWLGQRIAPLIYKPRRWVTTERGDDYADAASGGMYALPRMHAAGGLLSDYTVLRYAGLEIAAVCVDAAIGAVGSAGQPSVVACRVMGWLSWCTTALQLALCLVLHPFTTRLGMTYAVVVLLFMVVSRSCRLWVLMGTNASGASTVSSVVTAADSMDLMASMLGTLKTLLFDIPAVARFLWTRVHELVTRNRRRACFVGNDERFRNLLIHDGDDDDDDDERLLAQNQNKIATGGGGTQSEWGVGVAVHDATRTEIRRHDSSSRGDMMINHEHENRSFLMTVSSDNGSFDVLRDLTTDERSHQRRRERSADQTTDTRLHNGLVFLPAVGDDDL